MPERDWRVHSTNLVGVPTGLLASSAFNDYPVPLHIAGTRETSASLFSMLAQAEQPDEASDAFEKYMCAMFGEGVAITAKDGRRRYRTSYRQLLEDWAFNANAPAGAVLKGWVESRFGLMPSYHNGRIERTGSHTWAKYLEDKMTSHYHNNSIHTQLDLLYEFAQWMIARFFSALRPTVTLYRGVNALMEHEVVFRQDRHHAIVRMNNLVSFSTERDVADCFGDVILEARVPAVKVLFFRELLPRHALGSEAECLVIGGDYRVRLAYL